MTFSFLDDDVKLTNSSVVLPDLTNALNDCDFMQRIGAAVFSNLYPFVGLDLNALRANQTNASPVSSLFVGNLCAFLFNLHLLGIRSETFELIKLLISFVSKFGFFFSLVSKQIFNVLVFSMFDRWNRK